jgi:hypothetical protein
MTLARLPSMTIALPFALLLALAVSACQTPTSVAEEPLRADLRQRDQALLDAIAPGDRKTWDDTLSAGAVYVDENGVILDRAAFLNELKPLPNGTSGHIEIVDHKVARQGDVALVIHRDDETEDYFGQVLHAQYLMTETWTMESGLWKLALVHAYVVARDPPAIAVSASALDKYVGRYSGGTQLSYEIAREGDHLVGGRPGGKQRALLAEAPDVFFVAGEPRSRKIFRRDTNGDVVGFADRREGMDIVWQRAP